MEKHSHVFEQFIQWENLYNGYILARQNKRYRNEVLSYIRNVDDMIFMVPSKEQAHEVLGRTAEYLYDNLGLQFNSKTAIMPYDAGPEFVGRRIWPHKIQIRRSTSLHMKQHLKYVMEHYSTGELDLDYCLSVIQSYLGYMKHCDCDALRNKVLEDFVLVRHYAEENNHAPTSDWALEPQ